MAADVERQDRYFAHSSPDGGAAEPLREHLELVGERAATFAAPFGAGDEARMAGLLHDAGKAAEVFTLRLQGKASGLDHWTPGAALALHLHRQHGVAAALAIQGHHLGLARLDKASIRSLHELEPPATGATLTVDDPDELLRRLATLGVTLPPVESSVYQQPSPHAAALLDVRMLFSALVDADFLETAAHFDRDADGRRQYRPAAPELRPGEALATLEAEVARLAETNRARSSTDVQRLRADLLEACLDGAASEPGLFTLSAPTGSGKTLSMLAFALRHAHLHGLRRVVIAVPYLSILEQTAQVYRDLLEPVFGGSYVLEHHSLAGTRGTQPPGDEQADAAEVLRRRQAENWDAPLVLTTSVQLLESLFANRPGACRKLHRLADAVVLFDEVQTLPRPLAVATLATLSRLAERYGASVVFSTATQPAFKALDEHVGKWCARGWSPRELATAELELFRRLDRVEPEWRVGEWQAEDRLTWPRLVDELHGQEQVLCILNLKRHARDVAQRLKDRSAEGLFHLSTSMCPAHRQHVLAQVRERLQKHLPCRLVSTQCVEAGVDVDFPVVYRAFGPLDAIAQAAGRCNRNGTLPTLGRLVVFRPDVPERDAYPGGDYQQAADVTREVLSSLPRVGWNLQDPELYDRWYRRLYDVSGLGTEERRRERELAEAMKSRDFERTAREYRLIPDDSVQVVVPWDGERFEELRRASKAGPWVTADWMRAAQVHSVSIYRRQLDANRGVLIPAPLGARLPEQRSDDWFFLEDEEIYDSDFGLGEPSGVLMA